MGDLSFLLQTLDISPYELHHLPYKEIRKRLDPLIGLLIEEFKKKTNIGEDRISLLPDSLLCHILSFLTTNETVRSSVLSSRWRNLWKWVPTLDLDSHYFPKDKACAEFIDKFLNFQSKFYLNEFKLTTGYSVFHYGPCLRRVIKSKIQHLQIDNELGYGNIGIRLTSSLCEALVSLKLHFVRVNGSLSLSLPCLKIMYLDDCVFSEVLVIIYTPRLEYLTLIDSEFESFDIIMRMSDSVKVDIDVDFELEHHDSSERDIIYNLLNKFSAVGDLTVSSNTLELIHSLKDMNPLPKFHGLTRLRATMFLNTSLQVLQIVLERCPNLKHLNLVLVEDDDNDDYYWVVLMTMLSTVRSFCLVSSLESVEMESPITEIGIEKKLVRYFLDNATSLKKLVLRLNLSNGEKEDPHVLKKLFDSPRRSSVCQFEVITVV